MNGQKGRVGEKEKKRGKRKKQVDRNKKKGQAEKRKNGLAKQSAEGGCVYCRGVCPEDAVSDRAQKRVKKGPEVQDSGKGSVRHTIRSRMDKKK
jgi:ferredoxin